MGEGSRGPFQPAPFLWAPPPPLQGRLHPGAAGLGRSFAAKKALLLWEAGWVGAKEQALLGIWSPFFVLGDMSEGLFRA